MKNRFRGTWVLFALLVLMVLFVGCEEVTVDVPIGTLRVVLHNFTDQSEFDDNSFLIEWSRDDNEYSGSVNINTSTIEDGLEIQYEPADYGEGAYIGFLLNPGIYDVSVVVTPFDDDTAVFDLVGQFTIYDGQRTTVALDFTNEEIEVVVD